MVFIEIDGLEEREVLNVHYALHQEIDVEGRPTAITRGGTIHVKVKSLNDGNTDLYEWACDPYVTKKGKVKFEKRDGTNMKTLEFSEGYLVEYSESYDAVDNHSQIEEFTISAKKIDIGGVSHENRWAE